MILSPCAVTNYEDATARRDGLWHHLQSFMNRPLWPIYINNMRTFLYLILTAFVSTGAMFAGLNQHTPVLGYAIGLAAWAIYFWNWYRRAQKNAKK